MYDAKNTLLLKERETRLVLRCINECIKGNRQKGLSDHSEETDMLFRLKMEIENQVANPLIDLI